MNICGSWLITSMMSVLPDTWIDFAEMTWMGLVLTSFGAAMREPVTMISCSGGESVCPGGAWLEEPGAAWASLILSEVGVLACCARESAGFVPPAGGSDAPGPSEGAGSLTGTMVTVFSSRYR